jgi:hypothetical protein
MRGFSDQRRTAQRTDIAENLPVSGCRSVIVDAES